MNRIAGPAFVTGILAALLLMASDAFADEIVKFDLVTTTNAQPLGAPPEPLDASGQIVIDTTTGVVDAIDLSFSNAYDSTYPPTTSDDVFGPAPYNFLGFGEQWTGQFGDGYMAVEIWIPQVSLVGYDGGPICSTDNPCYGGPGIGNIESGFAYGISSGYPYDSGELVVSPEPSSLMMMITGALGICAMLSRKKAKAGRPALPHTI